MDWNTLGSAPLAPHGGRNEEDRDRRHSGMYRTASRPRHPPERPRSDAARWLPHPPAAGHRCRRTDHRRLRRWVTGRPLADPPAPGPPAARRRPGPPPHRPRRGRPDDAGGDGGAGARSRRRPRRAARPHPICPTRSWWSTTVQPTPTPWRGWWAIGRACIRLDRSGGPGVARNAGWRLVDADAVVFVDADVLPDEGWLRRLLPISPTPGWPRSRHGCEGGGPPARSSTATRSTARHSTSAPPRHGSRPAAAWPMSPRPPSSTGARCWWRPAGSTSRSGWARTSTCCGAPSPPAHTVRYEPAATVTHRNRGSWPALVRQRFAYGTSAAELDLRHPGAVAPVATRRVECDGLGVARRRRPAWGGGRRGRGGGDHRCARPQAAGTGRRPGGRGTASGRRRPPLGRPLAGEGPSCAPGCRWPSRVRWSRAVSDGPRCWPSSSRRSSSGSRSAPISTPSAGWQRGWSTTSATAPACGPAAGGSATGGASDRVLRGIRGL